MPSFRFVAALALSCAVVLFSACDKPTSPTGVTALSTNDLRLGSGAEVVSGSKVSVNYTLWLFDVSKTDQKGLQIETSVGGSPFTFTIGDGTVIKGWDQGVSGMRVGGIRRLIVPPSLGYGAERHNAIPAYATLVFDIELVSIE